MHAGGIYGRWVSSWSGHRVLGVDAARGLALLGMMAVHIVPPLDADGQVTVAFQLAAGRSSALFAVLAGVGLALLTRWSPSTSARQRGRDRVAVLVRALLLTIIGLALAIPDSGVAVILVYYGVMFALAVPFLGLRPAALAGWSAGVVLIVPLLLHLLRPVLPTPSYASPGADFLDGGLWAGLSELTITGIYPALPWMAYVLAGLAVGKLDLRSPVLARRLLVGGAALALGAHMLSRVLLGRGGGLTALQEDAPSVQGRPLAETLDVGLYGTTPTGSWWWLAVDAPHSSTPLDLAATIGSSLAVLGFFLLVVRVPRWWARPLIAVGGMTLTLYTLHVILLGSLLPRSLDHAYLWHVAVIVTVAMVWRRYVGQGPLELMTQQVSRRVSYLLIPSRGEAASSAGTTSRTSPP